MAHRSPSCARTFAMPCPCLAARQPPTTRATATHAASRSAASSLVSTASTGTRNTCGPLAATTCSRICRGKSGRSTLRCSFAETAAPSAGARIAADGALKRATAGAACLPRCATSSATRCSNGFTTLSGSSTGWTDWKGRAMLAVPRDSASLHVSRLLAMT